MVLGLFDSLSRKIKQAHEDEGTKLKRRISRGLSKITVGSTAHSQGSQKSDGQQAPVDEDEYEEDETDLIEDHAKYEHKEALRYWLLGFMVGLRNIWAFPYLMYHHGGAWFLLPYLAFTVLFSYPIMYLELLVGQITHLGCVASWKIAPFFKGVGICMILICFGFYFNPQAVMAWSVFYLSQSMYTPLPWVSCDNGFGKEANGRKDDTLESLIAIESDDSRNWHTTRCHEFYADTVENISKDARLPGSEFMRGRVQRMWKSAFSEENYTSMNNSAENGDHYYVLAPIRGSKVNATTGTLEFNGDTLIALLFSTIFTIGTATRGVNLNVTFLRICTYIPFVVLTVLFYRATGLPGAWHGLYILLKPRSEKLLELKTWWEAGEQVLNSAGCGVGIMLTLGSHTRQQRDTLADATACTIMNTVFSFLSAAVVFMFLGHIQHSVSVNVDVLISSGPELVFEVMADMLGTLAKANFYSIAFYTLLFFLAYTTIVVSLICSKTAFVEVLPVSIKYFPSYRTAIYSSLAFICTFATAVILSKAGLYVFNYIGTFVATTIYEATIMLFLIGITWIWGLEELVDATSEMGTRVPGIYFQICWKFISPILCLFLLFYGSVSNIGSYTIRGPDDEEVELTIGLIVLGFIMDFAPFIAIPLGAMHAIKKAPGKNFYEKFHCSISPPKDYKKILSTGKSKRAKMDHYFYFFASFSPRSFVEALQFFFRGPKLNQVAPTPIPSIFLAEGGEVRETEMMKSEEQQGKEVQKPETIKDQQGFKQRRTSDQSDATGKHSKKGIHSEKSIRLGKGAHPEKGVHIESGPHEKVVHLETTKDQPVPKQGNKNPGQSDAHGGGKGVHLDPEGQHHDHDYHGFDKHKLRGSVEVHHKIFHPEDPIENEEETEQRDEQPEKPRTNARKSRKVGGCATQ